MSAFMVSHECIHRVVLGMRSFHQGYAQQDRDLLGMMLVELNRRAIQARYRELPEVEPYRYVEPQPSNMMPIQVYKSLRCFLYQCSEGNVPDELLFKHAEQTRDRMAETLGHDTAKDRWDNAANGAAYQQADWG